MATEERDAAREELIRAAVNNSAFYRHVRMRLLGFDDAGSLLSMEVGADHMNLWGVAHGGAVSSLCDSACGTAVAQKLGNAEKVVTLDLRVQFLKPVPQGTIRARGRLVHRSKAWAMAECEVLSPDGAVLARAQSIHAFAGKENK